MPDTRYRLAILDDYLNVARTLTDWSRVEDRCEITVFNEHIADRQALLEALEPFDILCVMRERTPFPKEVVDGLPNLKFLVTSGARNAALDLEALKARGIPVCSTEMLNHPTPEVTMALMLGLARKIAPLDSDMKAGHWQRHLGRDLKGATLGIVGLGRLGAEVAARARPFGMNIMAWSQNLTRARCAELDVAYAEKDELFANADFVTLHLRLSDRTRHIVGAHELSLMKPDSYLINTSRGPLIDTEALLKALDAGRPAGAALDVYDTEPLPADHPLRKSDKLLLTPHVGYTSRENMTVYYEQTVEAVEGFLYGTPIRRIA